MSSVYGESEEGSVSQQLFSASRKESYSQSAYEQKKSLGSKGGSSRRRQHTESCLKNVMNVTASRVEAAEALDQGSQRALEMRVEALLVQNSELKRSLQTLQAGVVESMRGNKARMMGNGFGRGPKDTMSKGGVKLPHLAGDLDELRALLEKRREQINDLEDQLLEQVQRYESEKIAKAELSARHMREIELWEQRWEGGREKIEQVGRIYL